MKGKITSLTDFGAFVEIREGVEGMIHISEVSSNKIENLASVLTVGQEVEAMVLRLNPENKKIGLSIKAIEEAQEKKTSQPRRRAAKRWARTSETFSRSCRTARTRVDMTACGLLPCPFWGAKERWPDIQIKTAPRS